MSIILSADVSESTAVLLRLIAVLRRTMDNDGRRIRKLDSPSAAKRYFSSLFAGTRTEVLAAAALDGSRRIKASAPLVTGTPSGVSQWNRDIADLAVSCGAEQMIIAHSHPQGDCTPSGADISATVRLIALLDGLGVALIDHIIVGRDGVLSMRGETDVFSGVPAEGYGDVQKNCKK